MSQEKGPSLPKTQPWESITKRWMAAGLVLLFAFIIWQIHTIVAPLIIALLLAYVLNPSVGGIMRVAKVSRTVATLIVYFWLLVLLVALPVLLIPPIVEQIRALNLDFRAILQELGEILEQYQTIDILGFTIDLPQLYTGLQGQLASLLAALASQSINIIFGAASSLLWLIFILVVSFYILRDADRLNRYLEGLIPPGYRQEVNGLRREMGEIWDSFLRGQIILSLTVGVLIWGAMELVGVRNALVLGILAGILEVIPNIGPILAAIPAVILSLFQGSTNLPLDNTWFALLVAGIYVVIQQVENNLLVPRIIGDSVNLPASMVLIGAVAGASVAGLLGIFLAAPVMATLRVLGEYVFSKLVEAPVEAPVAVYSNPESQSSEGQELTEKKS